MADMQPTPLTPSKQPTQAAGPYDSLLNHVTSVYPRLKQLNLTVTQGKGPFYSETYGPTDDENPVKGRWNIQLRDKSKDYMSNPVQGGAMIASEALHGLAQSDKGYQKLHSEFKESFTPSQLRMAHEAYKQEKKEAGPGEVGSFDDWLDKSRVEAYVRGGLFPEINPEWREAGTFTPQQIQILDKIHTYLSSEK